MKIAATSVEATRNELKKNIGAAFPVRLVKFNREVMTGYIRGFADEKCNIALISEQADSLGMNILEIKNIRDIEYPEFQSRIAC